MAATATAALQRVEEDGEARSDVEFHGLQDSWCYYIFVYKKTIPWEQCLEKVATFESVEHFWGVLTQTINPSAMVNGNDIYMFKADIKPKWEDPKNENGGRWLINIPSTEKVDWLWEELLMLLIGSDWDTDEEAEQICGANFQPRTRGHRMSVWLTSDSNEHAIMQIGRRIKERLKLEDPIFFQTVSDQRTYTRGKDVLLGKYQV